MNSKSEKFSAFQAYNTNSLAIFGFVQESQMEISTVSELQKRLQIRVSSAHRKKVIDELKDKELVDLASQAIAEKALTTAEVLYTYLHT